MRTYESWGVAFEWDNLEPGSSFHGRTFSCLRRPTTWLVVPFPEFGLRLPNLNDYLSRSGRRTFDIINVLVNRSR
jgi:hypothetical protein